MRDGMFKKKQLTRQLETVSQGTVPRHLAIIMDGNGRWARKRGLPRVAGHRAGMDAINRCLRGANELDIKYLTLFAFSTENWRRPQAEVDFLMNLPRQFISKELDTMMANNIRLMVIGDMQGLPANTNSSIIRGVEATSANTGLTLVFALNYGAREEILRATRALGQMCLEGAIIPGHIGYEDFEKQLYTAGMPDIDLVIRTSGEIRISNFLLWQVAYAEFYFVDTLWPDFTEVQLYGAIAEYQQRHRRFGGV